MVDNKYKSSMFYDKTFLLRLHRKTNESLFKMNNIKFMLCTHTILPPSFFFLAYIIHEIFPIVVVNRFFPFIPTPTLH